MKGSIETMNWNDFILKGVAGICFAAVWPAEFSVSLDSFATIDFFRCFSALKAPDLFTREPAPREPGSSPAPSDLRGAFSGPRACAGGVGGKCGSGAGGMGRVKLSAVKLGGAHGAKLRKSCRARIFYKMNTCIYSKGFWNRYSRERALQDLATHWQTFAFFSQRVLHFLAKQAFLKRKKSRKKCN